MVDYVPPPFLKVMKHMTRYWEQVFEATVSHNNEMTVFVFKNGTNYDMGALFS